MEQLSPTVMMISGSEPIPEGTEDFVKIALMGPTDLNPANDSWQSKFAHGVAAITSTEPGKGIVQFRGTKILLLNCQSSQPQNPQMSFDNPEFVNKLSADLDYSGVADGIFFNFLKKSTGIIAPVEFSLIAQSGKVVTRCSNEYVNYGLIRTLCERFKAPLLPGATTSVLLVLQTMWSYIPKFQEIQKFKLPE